jgi:hypothetical protein
LYYDKDIMKEEKECVCDTKTVINKCCHHHGGSSQQCAIYGLGVIGSLFYFLHGVVGFGPILMGIGKAIFWPAFVVFKVLGLLQI